MTSLHTPLSSDGSNHAPVRRLIVTVHGIRTYGQWQERLEALLLKTTSSDTSLTARHYKFGHFSSAAFLLPPLRRLVLRRFGTELSTLIGSTTWSRVDLVGHSFGTYLIGKALLRINRDLGQKIHTVLLLGSVLRQEFPWSRLTDIGVQRVINDCGTKDNVLLLSRWLVLGTGMAGRIGFTGMTGATLRNRFFRIGHSGYFLKDGQPDDGHLETYAVPLLMQDNVAAVIDERNRNSLEGWITWLAEKTGPVKGVIYSALAISLVLWVVATVKERAQDQAFDIASAAELQDRNPMLLEETTYLAAASLKVNPSPQMDALLRDRIDLIAHRLDEWPITSYSTDLAAASSKPLVKLSSDGSHLGITIDRGEVRAPGGTRQRKLDIFVYEKGSSRPKFERREQRYPYPQRPQMLQVSNDGTALIVGRGINQAVVYDFQNGSATFMDQPPRRRCQYYLSPKGTFIVSKCGKAPPGTRYGRYETVTARPLHGSLLDVRAYEPVPTATLADIGFNKDDSKVALLLKSGDLLIRNTRGSDETTARVSQLFDLAIPGWVLPPPIPNSHYHNPIFNDSGSLIALELEGGGISDPGRQLAVADWANRQRIGVFPLPVDDELVEAGQLSLSAVTTTNGAVASVWDIRSGNELMRVSPPAVTGNRFPVRDILLNAQGRLVVATEGNVSTWESSSPSNLFIPKSPAMSFETTADALSTIVAPREGFDVGDYRFDRTLFDTVAERSVPLPLSYPIGRIELGRGSRLAGLIYQRDEDHTRLCVLDIAKSKCLVDSEILDDDEAVFQFSRNGHFLLYRPENYDGAAIVNLSVDTGNGAIGRRAQAPTEHFNLPDGVYAAEITFDGQALYTLEPIADRESTQSEGGLFVRNPPGQGRKQLLECSSISDFQGALRISHNGRYLAVACPISDSRGGPAAWFSITTLDLRLPNFVSRIATRSWTVDAHVKALDISDDGAYAALAITRDPDFLEADIPDPAAQVQVVRLTDHRILVALPIDADDVAFDESGQLSLVLHNTNGMYKASLRWKPAEVLSAYCEKPVGPMTSATWKKLVRNWPQTEPCKVGLLSNLYVGIGGA